MVIDLFLTVFGFSNMNMASFSGWASNKSDAEIVRALEVVAETSLDKFEEVFESMTIEHSGLVRTSAVLKTAMGELLRKRATLVDDGSCVDVGPALPRKPIRSQILRGNRGKFVNENRNKT